MFLNKERVKKLREEKRKKRMEEEKKRAEEEEKRRETEKKLKEEHERLVSLQQDADERLKKAEERRLTKLEARLGEVLRQMEEDANQEDRILLNVGGTHFETLRSTLLAYPDTLLGRLSASLSSSNAPPPNLIDGEYFFDRNPRSFAAILEWYRTNVLLVPEGMPLKMFYREMCFWGIPPNSVRGYRWEFFLLKRKCKEVVDAEREKELKEPKKEVLGKKPKPGSIYPVVARCIPPIVDSIANKKVRQRFFSITEAQTTFQLSVTEMEEGVVLFRQDDVFSRMEDEANREEMKKVFAKAGCPTTIDKFETKFTSGPRNGQYTGEFYFELKVNLDKIKLQAL